MADKVGDIMKWLGKRRLRFLQGQRGISFIETLVALAILATIGVVFLNALFTTSKIVAISQESVAVESLAKSQIEFIKSQAYVAVADYNPGNPAYRYEPINIPADLAGSGYTVEINAPVVVPGFEAGNFELQSVTVVIKRNGEKVFTISAYMVESPL